MFQKAWQQKVWANDLVFFNWTGHARWLGKLVLQHQMLHFILLSWVVHWRKEADIRSTNPSQTCLCRLFKYCIIVNLSQWMVHLWIFEYFWICPCDNLRTYCLHTFLSYKHMFQIWVHTKEMNIYIDIYMFVCVFCYVYLPFVCQLIWIWIVTIWFKWDWLSKQFNYISNAYIF